MNFHVRAIRTHMLMLPLLACVTAGCASVDNSKPPGASTRMVCTDVSGAKVRCTPLQEERLKQVMDSLMPITERVDHASLQRRYYQPAPRGTPGFVDALNRFKKYVIPESLKRDSTYWLGNDRIAFSSREYPGWKAKPDELSRIISYNIVTGEIVDSGYRGWLYCLNHQGDLLIGQPEKGSGEVLKLKDFQWLTGKWGQPLRRIDYLDNSSTIRHRCIFAPYGDPIYRYPPEELKLDAAMVTPLMPEHGAIRETVVRLNSQLQDAVFLIKPNGERVQISNRRPNYLQLLFQPWDESYFEVNLLPDEPRVIYPSGKTLTHPIPPLFLDWKKSIQSSVAPSPSRKGIVWRIQQNRWNWRKQGIYLQSDEGLLRIEDGHPFSFLQTSPDGCRIHTSGVRGDFYSHDNQRFNVVIDLCKENGK